MSEASAPICPNAAPVQRTLAAGSPLFAAREQGGLWRVVSGLVRMDRVGPSGQVLVMLACAGDLLGFESLCGEPYPFHASALNEVVLQPLSPVDDRQRQAWLIEAVLQQPQRSHDMARLRTGQVASRLTELLRLMGYPILTTLAGGHLHDADGLRNGLPPLRVLADVVDAKPETVCRVLAQLLPPRSRKRESGSWGVAASQTAAAWNRMTEVAGAVRTGRKPALA